MARVKTIQKAQKAQGKCGKCGKPVKKGDPYCYFKVGFRSNFKNVRCADTACYPRPSELTSSKMAEAYAAQEDAHDAIDAAASVEDITSALEECAQRATDLAREYEDSIDAAPMLEDQLREKVDALEQWADSMESPDLPDTEEAEDEQCEHCEGSGECDAYKEAEADDECGEGYGCTADGTCGNCQGNGTLSSDDDEGDSEEHLEEVRVAARELVDGLEA